MGVGTVRVDTSGPTTTLLGLFSDLDSVTSLRGECVFGYAYKGLNGGDIRQTTTATQRRRAVCAYYVDATSGHTRILQVLRLVR